MGSDSNMPIRRDLRRVISVPLLLNTMMPRGVFQRAMHVEYRCAHRRVDRMPRVEPKGFPTEEEEKEERGTDGGSKGRFKSGTRRTYIDAPLPDWTVAFSVMSGYRQPVERERWRAQKERGRLPCNYTAGGCRLGAMTLTT